jgi:glycosidase
MRTLLLFSLALGCAPPPPALDHTTNVVDWRDEVIYQVIVDRFANGDPNNDWNVDEGDLGRYQGGDWQGLIDHLDYFTALGVTTLWISPVVANLEEDAGFSSYHGYWTQAFDRHNVHWGEIEKLQELSQRAHERGIKLVLDIVVNHIAQLFYYDMNLNGRPDDNLYGGGGTWGGDEGTFDPNEEFELERVTEWDPDWSPAGIHAFTSLGDAGLAPIRWVDIPEIRRQPPEPPEFANVLWYNGKGRVTNWNDADQVELGDFPGGLKDLKTTLPEVRQALIAAFGDWIEWGDFDGFRIDTLKHVEMSFWPEFTAAMRQRAHDLGRDNFLMFGEAFDGSDELIGSYTTSAASGGGELDSVFYFSQKFRVFDNVIKHGNPTQEIEALWSLRDQNYGTQGHAGGLVDEAGSPVAPRDVLVNFLDNHDLPRFLFDQDGPGGLDPSLQMLHQALVLLLMEDGIPCIYYGTEHAFAGGNDPGNREVLWPTGFATDGETFQWIARLTALRREHPALRRGGLQVRWATPVRADDLGSGRGDLGIFAFERALGEDRVVVVLNTSDVATSVTSAVTIGGGDMATGFAAGSTVTDLLGSGLTATVGAGGTMRVELPPRASVVLGVE